MEVLVSISILSSLNDVLVSVAAVFTTTPLKNVTLYRLSFRKLFARLRVCVCVRVRVSYLESHTNPEHWTDRRV